MSGKRILMLIGDYSGDYDIFVFQQAMEAVGHTIDIICPDTHYGDLVATSVQDHARGIAAGAEHKGHAVEVTRDFATAESDSYDAVYIPGGRGPEHIRTRTRIRELVREFYLDDKPILALGRGPQVLVAVPDVIDGKRVAAYYTVEPEIRLTKAMLVKIGPRAALRDGNLVTAEDWTALAVFLRESMTVLGTEIVHHPIDDAPDMAAE